MLRALCRQANAADELKRNVGQIEFEGGVSRCPLADATVLALSPGSKIVQGVDRAGHHNFLRLLRAHVDEDLV